MMHAPTPPTIPYYSLLQEELFQIRPSLLRQFFRGILCRKLSGHSKPTLIPNRAKTVSIKVDQSWFVRCRPGIRRDNPYSDSRQQVTSLQRTIDAHAHRSE